MYEIFQMQKEVIPDVVAIWHHQYAKYCNSKLFPDFWSEGQKDINEYLEAQLKQGNAIVAKKKGKIVGFLAWLYFDFHNEKSAFCPVIGHATVESDSESIYHTLYQHAAQRWVNNDSFNHLWMIFNDSLAFKDMLYDIGFGSYVVDACKKTPPITPQIISQYKISKAVPTDVDVLFDLVAQTGAYYLSSPIFLKRAPYTKQDLSDTMQHSHLFVAWDNDMPVGMMNLSVNQECDTESLAVVNSGLINKLGAYVRPEYRGKGIGTCLLNEVFHYCKSADIPYVHVCFETANPFANKFWRKHFKPMILSVRRTVNKDANSL